MSSSSNSGGPLADAISGGTDGRPIWFRIFFITSTSLMAEEEAYFFYVFYITCMGLLIAQHNGLNYEYLWQHFPVWNQLAATILGSLTNLAALMFTIRFLNTKNDLPRAHKLLNGLCILITIIIILSLFESKIVNYVYQIIPTLSVLSILMIAFLRLKQNYKPAKYFLLAWTSLSLGVLSAILTNIELIPYNNLTVWSFQIGTIVEILFLALALSDRIKRSNIEKNDAILQKLDASMKLNALTNIFEKFVPYQFLQCLEKNDLAQIKLGDSAEQDMTVLFLDIRDFTSLSETLGPQKNFEFINEFISHLGPVIHNNHGFIDKFTGDGFMALFPINADNAVQASKEMIYVLNQWNKDRISKNEKVIEVGIGVNSGNLMLGIIGEQSRYEGTVISDAVNVASRIESLTKIYNNSLLITKETFLRLKLFTEEFTYIDTINVKGKTEQISVYGYIKYPVHNSNSKAS